MRCALILAVFSVSLDGCNNKEAPSEPSPTEARTPKADPVAISANPALGAPPGASAAGTDDGLKELLASEKDDPPPKQVGEIRPSTTDKGLPSVAASADPSKSNVAPSEPTGPIKIARGAPASDAAFEVWLETPGTHGAGKPGSVTAIVTAKDPYKCNAEYPYKFQTTGGAQVTYASPTVRGAVVDKKRTTLTIPFTPTESGRGEVKGTLSFSVCTDERCLVEKRDLNVAFAIQ